MTNRTYYTLAIRENGTFAPQFGDYSRQCVADELADILDGYDAPKKSDCRIISSGDSQSEINAAIAALNA